MDDDQQARWLHIGAWQRKHEATPVCLQASLGARVLRGKTGSRGAGTCMRDLSGSCAGSPSARRGRVQPHAVAQHPLVGAHELINLRAAAVSSRRCKLAQRCLGRAFLPRWKKEKVGVKRMSAAISGRKSASATTKRISGCCKHTAPALS
jgi:hypothetical protein